MIPSMRARIVLGCFTVGLGAGAWLGLVAASVSGLTSAEPPRLPGGHPAASALAIGVLAVLSVLAQRVGGIGIVDPARARAEGRGARNTLLLAATFSAFSVVFAVFAFGRVLAPSLLPSLVVAVLLAIATIRRDFRLLLAALCAVVLCVLAGLAVSVMRAFG